MASVDTTNKFTAPYASWRTFDNLLGRMADEGPPGRVDRSYLSNIPGSAQSEIQTTMKALGLIDEALHPTPLLGELVGGIKDGTASETARAILEAHYSDVLELRKNATQAQLVDAFRELNVTGSTLRKAIRFFLGAAEFAGIELSPHFKAPPADAGERRIVRKPKSTGAKATARGSAGPPQAPQANPGLHPFIAGLVGALPTPGEHFADDKQEAWFETARGIFRLIYAPNVASANPGGETVYLDLSDADTSEAGGDDD